MNQIEDHSNNDQYEIDDETTGEDDRAFRARHAWLFTDGTAHPNPAVNVSAVSAAEARRLWNDIAGQDADELSPDVFALCEALIDIAYDVACDLWNTTAYLADLGDIQAEANKLGLDYDINGYWFEFMCEVQHNVDMQEAVSRSWYSVEAAWDDAEATYPSWLR